MSPTQRVVSILNSQEASRIRFTCPTSVGNITLTRNAFSTVAHAVSAGTITITVQANFRPGVGAEYHTDTDTLFTPPLIGRADEGLVLHECTHAFFDLTSSPIGALEDEACAYVVDALYFRMSALPSPRWNNSLHAQAGRVAKFLLEQYAVGNVAVPTVDTGMWHILRAMIATDAVYLPTPASSGGKYLHNG